MDTSPKSISVLEKIILQKRINTIEFMEKEEDLARFNCMNCHQVAIYRVQLQCSHILCGDCFAKLYLMQCPDAACSSEVTACQGEDNQFEEALSELRVTCQNKANGCPEVTSIRNLLAHEKSCPYSPQFNKEAIDLATCKQQITELQQQLAEIKMSVMQIKQTHGQPRPETDNEIKETVVEEIRKERAKEQLKLETKLTEKFQTSFENKMDVIQTKVENILLSRQDKLYQYLENRMCTQLHNKCDVIQKTTSKDTIKMLSVYADKLKNSLENDLLGKTNDVKKSLQEESKAFIQEVLDFKCPEMEQRSYTEMAMMQSKIENRLESKQEKYLQNLENRMWIQLHDNFDVIQGTTSEATIKLSDDLDVLRKSLESDVLGKINEVKKLLQEESRAFIQVALDDKCSEMEKRTFANMEVIQSKIQNTLQSNQEKGFENLQLQVVNELIQNCDAMEAAISKKTTKMLSDDVERIKKRLDSDLKDKTNDAKQSLEDKSKAFIQQVLAIKCPEMEKRSFDKLAEKVEKHSENVIENIIQIADVVKESLDERRNELLTNDHEACELNFKEKIFQLEKGLKEKYQGQNDVIRVLHYSQLQSDDADISQAVNLLLPKSKTLIWDIGNFEDNINDDKIIILSNIIHIPEFGCKMKFTLKIKPSIGIHVEYLEQATNKLDPLSGHYRITFTLKDQIEHGKYKDFVRIFEPTFNDWLRCAPICVNNITSEDVVLFHARWLKDGEIQMKVTLEPLVHIVAIEPRQYGTYMWKIDHYSDVCESFNYGWQCLLSDSFYSSENGYRLKAFFHIGDCVSFELYFLKGPWDNDLSEEFKHRTTICIISQEDNDHLKDKTFSKTSDSARCDEFPDCISKKELKKYVKNDSLDVLFIIESL